MRLILVLLSALLVVGAVGASIATAADPPVADTGAASGIGQTQATLTAKVDPQGSATSVRFDLGTSTAYGLQSASKDAGAGSGAVTIEIPVQGLTAATTYHFRVAATSAGGTVQGGDATFRTAAVPVTPTKPAVTTGAARDVAPSSATLTGSITPHSAATTYHFEYGTSTGYGTSTPSASAGAGTHAVAVSAHIGGLTAGKTYHYRLVASNSAGLVRGGDRTVVAATTPTAATLTVSANPVVYGRPVTLSGTLAGSKKAGVRVRLQTTAFPFSAPFGDTGNALKSTSTGTFAFTLPVVTTTTRAVVIADGLPSILSPIVVVRSAVRTGIRSVRRRADGSVVVTGRLTPATPGGVAALQREGSNGRWLPLRHADTAADGSYTVTLAARRKAMTIRTVGLAHDGGAHVSGTSRSVKLAAAHRKR